MNGRRRGTTVLVIATAALLVAAIWASVMWREKVEDAQVDRARARDAVLLRAQDAAAALSSLDYRKPAAATAIWGRVATGNLLKSLVAGRKDFQQLISAGRVVATAKVVGGAVQSLDSAARAAVVLVGLDITVRPASAQPSVEHERLVVTMTLTPQGWKAAAMAPVVD